MKNYKVMRDTLDQILIVDMNQTRVNVDENSMRYLDRYFITGDCSDYIGIHVNEIENQAEAARILAEWKAVEANQTFVNPKVLCWEVCTDETRYKVTRDMPDWIVAYVDYIDPLKDRTATVTEPEPEMQYINRRESDGALWPTPFQVVSAGWLQISAHPLNDRYEVGDTVLIHDRAAKPELELRKCTIAEVCKNGTLIFSDFSTEFIERCINFTKGDHLTPDEREAWHQESTGYQDSYYKTFQK